MRTSFVFLLLIAGCVWANSLFNTVSISDDYAYGKKDDEGVATLANGNVISFINIASSATFGDFKCEKTTCGIVYDKKNEKKFLTDNYVEFTHVFSAKDDNGKWHVYVSGHKRDSSLLSIGGNTVPSTGLRLELIIQLSDTLEYEKVITVDSVAHVESLTVYKGKLAILFSVLWNDADVPIVVDGVTHTIAESLLQDDGINVIAVANLGDESSFVVQKIFGSSSEIYPKVVSTLPVDNDSTMFAIPYVLQTGNSFTVGSITCDQRHAYVVVLSLCQEGGSTQFKVKTVVDAEALQPEAVSTVFLNKDTLVVAQNLGDDDFDNCLAQTTSVAKYSTEDSTRSGLKCINSEKRSSLLSVSVGVVDSEHILLASSFYYYIFVDNVTVWRSRPITSTSEKDSPFVALINTESLEVEDARAFFTKEEPSYDYKPIGFVSGDGSARLLFSGRVSSNNYAVRLAEITTQTCSGGVFNKTGFCICHSGDIGKSDPTFVCPDVPSSNPSSHTGSGDLPSSGGHVTSGSSPAGSSTPKPLPGTSSANASEEEAFFGSQLSVIVFGCTAGAFLIVSVVFIALFSKKRCSNSSGSGNTELQDFDD